MPLSEFEIGKIAEIVAGKVGSRLDAKALRQVIDSVVDKLATDPGKSSVKGATCEVSATVPLTPEQKTPGVSLTPGQNTPSVPDESLISREGGLYERIDKDKGTRVILAAFGHNRPGVIAAVTSILAENMCNLEDISQKIMQEFFTLIMIVDIAECPVDFSSLVAKIKETETRLGMKVYMMREDTFQYMHRI